MIRRTLTMLTIACLLGAAATSVRAWEPAAGPLLTKWAKDVSPDRVWPEYPRPQMVRPNWTNLNGLWQYAIRPQDAGQPDDWDGTILVPFAVESALSGVMKPLKPEQQLWYRRTFEAPEAEGGRVLLHFGAVDWKCTVSVNGQQVGQHTGGYDPFSLDVTEALRAGENEVVVCVWDPTDTSWQPRGKQVLKPGGIMYTAVSGIWQTVWLEAVPAVHIRSLKIVPDVDRQRVSVTVDASRAAKVRLTAKSEGTRVAQAEGSSGEPVQLPIADARLWSPDQPHLYELEVELLDGQEPTDSVASYFGMRKIEVRKDDRGINRLFLNGQVLFQYGPLDQGWWPDGLYTPATEEAMKFDIEMTRKFGMNMARKHVKYESARWYYWCDKLGLLVWQDMPSGNAGQNEQSKANYRRELKAMIDALHNFPSIVMWVPFNEGWGQHDTPEVVKWVQDYDPTRPVNEASGWTDKQSGDVSDAHSYPGPGMRPVEEKRVSVLGEFGGLGMPVKGHLWQEDRNWGYVSFKTSEDLTDAYVGLLTAMRRLIGAGLSAAVYTQTTDVEIEVNGLMTYDREVVKMDLKRIAQAAAKLHLPPPVLREVVPTSRQQAQTWRYTTDDPGDNWFQVDFDDSSWNSGPGGFGTRSTPGAVVGTEWKTGDIWIRRTFELQELPQAGELCLNIHHDEDAKVYINGQLVRELKGYTRDYVPVPLGPTAARSLRQGPNTIAIHCHQTEGGQFIDAGLVLQVEQQ